MADVEARCLIDAKIKYAQVARWGTALYPDTGISAGIDLALSLVERDHGPTLTAGVARELVVYLRRDGTTLQVSALLEHRTHLNSAVHRVQDHLAQRLDIPHTLAELAGIGAAGVATSMSQSVTDPPGEPRPAAPRPSRSRPSRSRPAGSPSPS